MESLAVLGKLGVALDVVASRLPSELFGLVEGTIEEISERAEFIQRMTGSHFVSASNGSGGGSGGRATDIFLVASSNGGSNGRGGVHLRLAGLERSAKTVDQETLRDLFWTVYSKFDAVLQGLRVVSEVANRIGSVSSFPPIRFCSCYFCLVLVWMGTDDCGFRGGISRRVERGRVERGECSL